MQNGALNEAQALLEALPQTAATHIETAFDVSLILDDSARFCQSLAPEHLASLIFEARFFCLVQAGEWDAAALALAAMEALELVTDETATLLWAYLDPDLAEKLVDAQPDPGEINPLIFAVLKDVGLPLNVETLPIKFAAADLDGANGWRAQIDAAIRLAQRGTLSGNELVAIFTQGAPSASGRIWDHVAAWQRFDSELARQNPQATEAALTAAWDAAIELNLEVVFAGLYAKDLKALPLGDDTRRLSHEMLLLTREFDEAVRTLDGQDASSQLLRAIADGQPLLLAPKNERFAAANRAFADGEAVSPTVQRLLDAGRIGEALLKAIADIDAGWIGDPSQLTSGLATLRAIGLEREARQIALQILLLEPRA